MNAKPQPVLRLMESAVHRSTQVEYIRQSREIVERQSWFHENWTQKQKQLLVPKRIAKQIIMSAREISYTTKF